MGARPPGKLIRVPRLALLGLGVAWLWGFACPAGAHLLNMSRVLVELQPARQVTVTLELDLTRALGGPDGYFEASRLPVPLENGALAALAGTVARATALTAGEVRVPLEVVGLKMPRVSRADFHSPLEWPRARLTLRGQVPPGATPGHSGVGVVFTPEFLFEEPIAVTLAHPAAGNTLTRWVVLEQRSPVLDAPGWAAAPALPAPVAAEVAPLEVLTRYLLLGFHHILPGGYDHLLFVLGLFLGAATVRALVLALGMYTLAHSLTLAMATLGWIPAPAGLVEPLITLSITWVAVENLVRRGAGRSRYGVAFGFGLVHGLGFAGALGDSGLPLDARLAGLVGFNLGVELGQLCFVAALAALLARARARAWYRPRLVVPASLFIGLLALTWTVARL